MQLYAKDGDLAETVVNYALDILEFERQAIVFFATRRHCDLFKRGLLLQKVDVGDAIAGGRLSFLPIEDVLPRIFVDGAVDAVAFRRLAAETLRGARRDGRFRHLHVFGEIVDVLWQDGHKRATLQLENLWNELRRQEAFTLYCAFHVDQHVAELLNGPMRDVLCTHDSLLSERSHDGLGKRRSFTEVAALARTAANLPLIANRTGLGRSAV